MKSQVSGRITTGINVTKSESGVLVANFGLARNVIFRNRKSGRRQTRTIYYSVSAFNGMAKMIEHNLMVGDLVDLEVSVAPNVWTDKETGEEKKRLQLSVRSYELKGGGRARAAMQ